MCFVLFLSFQVKVQDHVRHLTVCLSKCPRRGVIGTKPRRPSWVKTFETLRRGQQSVKLTDTLNQGHSNAGRDVKCSSQTNTVVPSEVKLELMWWWRFQQLMSRRTGYWMYKQNNAHIGPKIKLNKIYFNFNLKTHCSLFITSSQVSLRIQTLHTKQDRHPVLWPNIWHSVLHRIMPGALTIMVSQKWTCQSPCWLLFPHPHASTGYKRRHTRDKQKGFNIEIDFPVLHTHTRSIRQSAFT